MTKKVVFILSSLLVYLVLTACTTTAVFKSLDTDRKGDLQILKGRLIKPSGNGPFPAVVLLHGCAGIWEHDSEWMNRLQRGGMYPWRILLNVSEHFLTDTWQITDKPVVSSVYIK